MTENKNVLLAAGSNAAGQLGLGHLDDSHIWQRCLLDNKQSFPLIGSRICHLSSGSAHSVAILQDDINNNNEKQVWGCGSGADGQLGMAHWKSDDKNEDDKKPLLNFTRLNIEDLLANSQHPSSSSKWSPKLVECGWDWTLLVLEDRKGKEDDLLLVLGINNDFLQLGYTRNKDVKTCSQNIDLRSLLCVPKEQREMPRIQIDAIACGLRHSIVVCSAKSKSNPIQNHHWLVGWGASRHGQIGKVQLLQSNKITSASRSKIALACLPRVIQTWQNEGGENEKDVVRLAAGKEHSVILIPSLWQIESTVSTSSSCGFEQSCQSNPFSFGSNRNSQCALNALPSNDEKIQWDGTNLIGATWNGTFLITSDRSSNSINVLSCGNNAKGQSGTGNAKPMHETESGVIHSLSIDNAAAATDHARPLQQSVQLACGSEHVALLYESKSNIQTSTPQARVIGWGWNEHGNLAQNDEKDRHIPVQIWPIESNNLTDQTNLPNAKPINCWAGCGTTFLQLQL